MHIMITVYCWSQLGTGLIFGFSYLLSVKYFRLLLHSLMLIWTTYSDLVIPLKMFDFDWASKNQQQTNQTQETGLKSRIFNKQ